MLNDDEILERGGTQEDIDKYAHDVGGACGASDESVCDYCGQGATIMQEDELKEKIQKILNIELSISEVAAYAAGNKNAVTAVMVEEFMLLIKQYSKDYADREYEYIASKDPEHIQNIEWIQYLEGIVARENTEESKHRLEIAKSHTSGYERGVRAVFESKRQRNQEGSK